MGLCVRPDSAPGPVVWRDQNWPLGGSGLLTQLPRGGRGFSAKANIYCALQVRAWGKKGNRKKGKSFWKEENGKVPTLWNAFRSVLKLGRHMLLDYPLLLIIQTCSHLKMKLAQLVPFPLQNLCVADKSATKTTIKTHMLGLATNERERKTFYICSSFDSRWKFWQPSPGHSPTARRQDHLARAWAHPAQSGGL